MAQDLKGLGLQDVGLSFRLVKSWAPGIKIHEQGLGVEGQESMSTSCPIKTQRTLLP